MVMFRTHMAFGLFFGLVIMSFINVGNIFLYIGFVLFGAGLPDIDSSNSKFGRKLGIFSFGINSIFGHRGIFHSVWMALFFSGLLYVFVGKLVGVALFVGYFSHILIDGFTLQGVNLLHPFGSLNLRGFIETGGFLESILFFGLVVLNVVLIFNKFIYAIL